jgi:hypothetical protein
VGCGDELLSVDGTAAVTALFSGKIPATILKIAPPLPLPFPCVPFSYYD